MAQNNNILQELHELNSVLAGKNIQHVYTVPDGYFEGLADQVMNRIKALEAKNAYEELSYLSPMLNNISKGMPYSVPDGYFETCEETLMQTVRESSDYQTPKEELESLSPLLGSLKKQMPYSIPQDYFENLNKRPLVIPNTKSETKIVSITSRKWFRYAAAAMVVGIIALAGFLYFGQKSSDPVKSFAKFEKKLDKEIKTTSDKDLSEFVQQFTDAGLSGDEKVQNNPKEDMKQMLKDVSDNELKEFIQEIADPNIADKGGTPIN
ncbi:MAG: hypothetical protein JJE22_10645 [Bacteroidia bacterium]|nr:hypothetical protein [Bacteroidia bacterium]